MAREGLDVMKAEELGFVQQAAAPPTPTTSDEDSDEDRELTADEYNAYLDQHALDEYNRRFQGELVFMKILKVMGQFVSYFEFYITLEAKDLADGGRIKTYQTVVEVKGNDYYVSSFRLKPPEDEQGSSNQPKEWFWKDSLC